MILWQGGPLSFDIPISHPTDHSDEVAKPPTRRALLTREDLKRQERDAIMVALKQAHGKICGPGGAAELLGMKPTTLASRIAALGVNAKR
jgi:transcriptional regulator with GAF, ATPase, and Fis domain